MLDVWHQEVKSVAFGQARFTPSKMTILEVYQDVNLFTRPYFLHRESIRFSLCVFASVGLSVCLWY